MPLVEITEEHHGVSLNLVYATPDNFTGKQIYARADCYLHPTAETMLRRTVKLAHAIGLRVQLLDAFRPTEAQWTLWKHCPDPEYLADPRTGSPHSRGVAVDVTLLDPAGDALDMGTDFDEFTPQSRHGSSEVSVEAQKNRYILSGLMATSGWDFYFNEWWHYQLFDTRRFPLLGDNDLPRPLMASEPTS